MKKIISIILVMFVSFCILSGCNIEVVEAPTPEVYENEDFGEYGKVVLSFPIISDIHFSSVCNEYVMDYYPKALEKSLSETKNRLSCVLVPGDFSEGYLKDYDTLITLTRQSVGSTVPLLASYGNHEGDNKHYQYEQKFGKPIDSVNEINGYNIILIGAHAGNTYAETQVTWLDSELARLTSSNPTKPVFIAIHHPVYDTHTASFGNPEFRSVLNKYPQAFVICGHEHAEFVPASFWQREFTSFRCSFLRNEEKGQYALLRLTDKNYIIIKKYEVKMSDAEPYIIIDDIIVDFNSFLNSKK